MSSLLTVPKAGGDPVQALVQAIPGLSAAGLDVPVAGALQVVQAKFVGHFSAAHGLWQVLLVRKDEECGVSEVVLLQKTVELVTRDIDTVAIVGVDDKDDAVRVGIVMTPEGSNLVLATDVPDGEAEVFIVYGLNVEANGRDRRHSLAQLELVEDGGLAGRVEADHEHPLFGPSAEQRQPVENVGEDAAHVGDGRMEKMGRSARGGAVGGSAGGGDVGGGRRRERERLFQLWCGEGTDEGGGREGLGAVEEDSSPHAAPPPGQWRRAMSFHFTGALLPYSLPP